MESTVRFSYEIIIYAAVKKAYSHRIAGVHVDMSLTELPVRLPIKYAKPLWNKRPSCYGWYDPYGRKGDF